MKNNLQPTNLSTEVNARITDLEQTLKKVRATLEKCPKGKIHIVRKSSGAQFYLRKESTEKTGKYLKKKKDQSKIELYARKRYLEVSEKALTAELESLKQFTEAYSKLDGRIRKVYSDLPADVKIYIVPIDMSDEDYAKEWLAMPYQKNPMHIANQDNKTENGEIVRSKSEVFIANELAKRNIPYKYEAALRLKNGNVIYPDFTILDIKRRKEIFWEHRGMMDDRDYAKNTVKRLKEMAESGIFPGDTLIITEEVAQNPFGPAEAKRVVDHYFVA